MPELVVPFGPPAVGKMTAGYALERRTGLRLFHNHMSVDVVLHLFGFGTPPCRRLVGEIRRRIVEEAAASELPGLIFTFVWALGLASDRGHVDALCDIFRARGAEPCFVELQATQAERLRRNETPLRLREKAPKRDVARSRRHLLDADVSYRLDSGGDFFYPERHLRIDTTALEPDEVAERIIARFGLPRVDA